jgi:hypothetical protein
VNDPSAVQSLDRSAQLLTRDRRARSWRGLAGRSLARDSALWYATPDWDDCVLLAFSEIRGFGAKAMPVARRLRAVLLDLCASVPSDRRPALETQLRLLETAVADAFPDETERAQAMTADRQGSAPPGRGSRAHFESSSATATTWCRGEHEPVPASRLGGCRAGDAVQL